MSEIDDATQSLSRVQEYDAESLAQADRLGRDFQFAEVIEPAKNLVTLFRKIPASALSEFPVDEMNRIKSQADSIYNLFEQIMTFDPKQADAQSRHQSLVEQVKNQYQPVFSQLYPLISYSMARTVDFETLASQGRAAVQGVKDQAQELMRNLADRQGEAKEILEEVRKTAAEQGVSQQARYFAEESTEHGKKAENWKLVTVGMAIAVAIFGILSFFTHRLPFVAPENFYDVIQLIASKVLVFFVLIYMLILSARNFHSHRHNEIVNKHRQNALMTYTRSRN